MHNDIKYKAFGKVTIGNRREQAEEEKDNEDDSDEKKAEEMLMDQQNIIQKELNIIKKTKNGKAGQVWAVRRKVIGEKKSKIIPNAIEDPETGKLVVNANKIKEVTLKYCMDTLKNNEPEEPFRKEIDDKKRKSQRFPQ